MSNWNSPLMTGCSLNFGLLKLQKLLRKKKDISEYDQTWQQVLETNSWKDFILTAFIVLFLYEDLGSTTSTTPFGRYNYEYFFFEVFISTEIPIFFWMSVLDLRINRTVSGRPSERKSSENGASLIVPISTAKLLVSLTRPNIQVVTHLLFCLLHIFELKFHNRTEVD